MSDAVQPEPVQPPPIQPKPVTSRDGSRAMASSMTRIRKKRVSMLS
jgi:hypothetical protein